MSEPPFPSFPSSRNPRSQPSSYRYLGRGGPERPLRIQIVLALVFGLVLVAIPLYLWRRPAQGEASPMASAPSPTVSAKVALSVGVPGASATAPPVFEGVKTPPSVSLSAFTTLHCESPGPSKTPPERCDHVMFFEDALARVIRENIACAPSRPSESSVTYVLETDFRRRKVNVFAGKSSSMKKTKDLLRCVKRAMPTPEWDRIPHQYSKYRVSVVATYPPSDGL